MRVDLVQAGAGSGRRADRMYRSLQDAKPDVNAWTGHGPPAGHVTLLVMAPDEPAALYAATYYGGLFKSTDGTTWSLLSGLNPLSVNGLAVGSEDPSILYAASDYGMSTSTDGGATWTDSSLANLGPVTALVLARGAPATLFLGTARHGVVESTDAGVTWSAAGPIPAAEVAVLTVSPSEPTTIYAGTDGGVFKSTDWGRSWAAANTGLPSGSGIAVLAIDANAPSVVYAAGGSPYSGFGGGLFKSVDAGEHWIALDAPPLNGPSVSAVAVDPCDSARIYAATADYENSSALLKSEDGGTTWQSANLGFAFRAISTIIVDPRNRNTLYVGSGAGVFKSTDAGAHWDSIVSGITNTSVHAVAVDPAAPDAVYAATWHDGIFKSTDRGGTWNAANGDRQIVSASALLIDPSHEPSTVYLGTTGVLKSTDGAATWTSIGLDAHFIGALAQDPRDPSVLYADSFKSTDAGGSWAPLGMRGGFSFAVDPNDPDILYMRTSVCAEGSPDPDYCDTVTAVFKSTDGGVAWKDTAFVHQSVDISLAVAGTTPTTVYAGTSGNSGLFASTDGGDSWTRLPVNLLYNVILSVVVDQRVPTTVYAGGNGVGKSTDGGQTWHMLSGGGLKSTVFSLAIDPSNPNAVYAGTDGQGVLSFEEVVTPSPTATPTPTTLPRRCIGDCDGDGLVTVDEILTMVSIALGEVDGSLCSAGAAGGRQVTSIDQIVTAVDHALYGCPR